MEGLDFETEMALALAVSASRMQTTTDGGQIPLKGAEDENKKRKHQSSKPAVKKRRGEGMAPTSEENLDTQIARRGSITLII